MLVRTVVWSLVLWSQATCIALRHTLSQERKVCDPLPIPQKYSNGLLVFNPAAAYHSSFGWIVATRSALMPAAQLGQGQALVYPHQ